jgi:hypothetical protein
MVADSGLGLVVASGCLDYAVGSVKWWPPMREIEMKMNNDFFGYYF